LQSDLAKARLESVAMHKDEDVNKWLKFDSMDRSPLVSHLPKLLPFDLSPLPSTACKSVEREHRTSMQMDMLIENEDHTNTPTCWAYNLERKLIAADSCSDIVRCISHHSNALTNSPQLQTKVESLTRTIADQEVAIATSAQS
jgi:hypothetical protein